MGVQAAGSAACEVLILTVQLHHQPVMKQVVTMIGGVEQDVTCIV
jgi:hypothetical protein